MSAKCRYENMQRFFKLYRRAKPPIRRFTKANKVTIKSFGITFYEDVLLLLAERCRKSLNQEELLKLNIKAQDFRYKIDEWIEEGKVGEWKVIEYKYKNEFKTIVLEKKEEVRISTKNKKSLNWN
jgi:hypothetical protein